MAVPHGKVTEVLVDAFDLSGFLDEVTVSEEIANAATTAFKRNSVTRITGIDDGSLSYGGFFEKDDVNADDIENVMRAALGASDGQIVTVGQQGSTVIGHRVKMLLARAGSWEINSVKDDAATVSGELKADGGVEGGVIVSPLGARTATVSTNTVVDNGLLGPAVSVTSSSVANPTVITATAHGLNTGDVIVLSGHSGATPSLNGTAYTVTKVSDNTFTIPVNVTVGGTGGTFQRNASRIGAVGHLHCIAKAGTTPTLAVKIQHSLDNSTWVDLMTFATLNNATGKERIEYTGVIYRYVRCIYTITGTGPSFTFAVAFARRGA